METPATDPAILAVGVPLFTLMNANLAEEVESEPIKTSTELFLGKRAPELCVQKIFGATITFASPQERFPDPSLERTYPEKSASDPGQVYVTPLNSVVSILVNFPDASILWLPSVDTVLALRLPSVSK